VASVCAYRIWLEMSFKLDPTSYEMREFSREETGIQFGKSTGMKMNTSSNGNEDENWCMHMAVTKNEKPQTCNYDGINVIVVDDNDVIITTIIII